MKRLIINLLAVIGTLAVVGTLTGAALRALAGPDHVIVLGAKGKPLPNAPVFLDRGSMAIERYVTDSAGRLRFELTTGELRRATWLVCAPGAIPMVGTRDDDQAGPTTYSFTALHDSSWGWYRANGWRGPIPRECPRGTDSLGWRYPASSGKPKEAITFTEPTWSH